MAGRHRQSRGHEDDDSGQYVWNDIAGIYQLLSRDSIPLFSSASGKVHLAFCDSAERATILKGLREYGKSDDKAMAFFSAAQQQGDKIRKNGFATHERNKHVDPPGKTSSISVPIFAGDAFVSTLNLIFFASAMSMKVALGKYLSELKAASLLITEKADAVPGT